MRTKEEILENEIRKAARTKLGITYNAKIKRVALECMQIYANEQLISNGLVTEDIELCNICGEKNDLKNAFCFACGSAIKDVS